MKKWTLILLSLAVVLLFLWTAREGFEPTANIKGPPYGDSDYAVIVNLMPATLVKALETANSAVKPVLPSNPSTGDTTRYANALLAYQKLLVDGKISSVMSTFYSDVYKPATVTLTSTNVDTFLTANATSGFLKDNKADVKILLKKYFVDQTQGAANAALTDAQTRSAGASTASGFAALLAASDAGVGLTPECRTEIQSKQWADVSAACKTGATGGATGTGDAAGNSTGGSSTTYIPTSGPNNGNIWGPAFAGLGDNAGFGATGNTKRDYPTLLGPKPKESVLVEGAGIAPVSQHTSLVKSGILPGASGTGSDPNSRFFGSSRVPGDRDLIPDSNQEFTPSIGSAKTEPVPYLSDFSAFLH
jgi:hypothetical protein